MMVEQALVLLRGLGPIWPGPSPFSHIRLRPNIPFRPNQGGPNIQSRLAIPNIPSRPKAQFRPIMQFRPQIPSRPNINIPSRPNIQPRPNIQFRPSSLRRLLSTVHTVSGKVGRRKTPKAPAAATDFTLLLAASRSWLPKGVLPLIRVGSFFEAYGETAVLLSRCANITLTAKSFCMPDEAKRQHPMCGFPLAQLPRQLEVLVNQQSRRVAVYEEMHMSTYDKRKKRQLVRIYTPGTMIEADFSTRDVLTSRLLVIQQISETKYDLVCSDLSTGELAQHTVGDHLLPDEIARIDPVELVLARSLFETWPGHVQDRVEGLGYTTTFVEDLEPSKPSPIPDNAMDLLKHFLRLTFPVQQPSLGRAPDQSLVNDRLMLDINANNALDIRKCAATHSARGSLVSVIKRTSTAGGTRALLQRLIEGINERLDAVEFLLKNAHLREDIQSCFRYVSDSAKLLAKIEIRIQHNDLREFGVFANAYATLGLIGARAQKLAARANVPLPRIMAEVIQQPSLFAELHTEIELVIDGLDFQPQAAATEDTDDVAEEDESEQDNPSERIWRLKQTATPDLIAKHGELSSIYGQHLELERKLARKHSTPKLQLIRMNGKIPAMRVPYSRKLAEEKPIKATKTARFYENDDWSKLAVEMDECVDSIRRLEEGVINHLHAKIVSSFDDIRTAMSNIDEVDVATGFAQLAYEFSYCRPTVDMSTSLEIIDGRHPTVEIATRLSGTEFTRNSISMLAGGPKFTLITGPNMGGKSTFLRQVALIVLMAQAGSFVPAAKAHIGIVERIFTRIGAQDSLYQGRSTFMQEMSEVSEMLKYANSRSLVLLDEVGRGTSPQEGYAIAYASAHHLIDENKARTLFATHFHDLPQSLEEALGPDKVLPMCTSISENDGRIMFDHRLRPGVSKQSHGIALTKVTNFPPSAVQRAEEMLEKRKKAS